MLLSRVSIQLPIYAFPEIRRKRYHRKRHSLYIKHVVTVIHKPLKNVSPVGEKCDNIPRTRPTLYNWAQLNTHTHMQTREKRDSNHLTIEMKCEELSVLLRRKLSTYFLHTYTTLLGVKLVARSREIVRVVEEVSRRQRYPSSPRFRKIPGPHTSIPLCVYLTHTLCCLLTPFVNTLEKINLKDRIYFKEMCCEINLLISMKIT